MKNMTQVGKMFVYIALRQLQAFSSAKGELLNTTELNASSAELVRELMKLGVVNTCFGGKIAVTTKGAPLVARYFAACADELRSGKLGKFAWSKRTKFHKAVLARIA